MKEVEVHQAGQGASVPASSGQCADGGAEASARCEADHVQRQCGRHAASKRDVNPLFIASSFVNDQVAGRWACSPARRPQERVRYGAELPSRERRDRGFERNTPAARSPINRCSSSESDFQADLSKIRAAKADSVFIFAPCDGHRFREAMGRFRSTGREALRDVDISHVTLPRSATRRWRGDGRSLEFRLDIPRNQRFIKDHIAKWGEHPSHFTVTAYDAVAPLARTPVNGRRQARRPRGARQGDPQRAVDQSAAISNST